MGGDGGLEKINLLTTAVYTCLNPGQLAARLHAVDNLLLDLKADMQITIPAEPGCLHDRPQLAMPTKSCAGVQKTGQDDRQDRLRATPPPNRRALEP